MKKIRVGTCGQVVSWAKFFLLFDALEINSTFYRFPTDRQVKNWQKHLLSAKEKGAFVSLKAHQLFTHPLRSPTWKRSEFGPEEREQLKGLVGCLKWNPFTEKQLKTTAELASSLGADFILFQLPAACHNEREQVLPFFKEALKRLPTRLGLEIRWEDLPLLEEASRLGVVPVFDPFLEENLRESFFPSLPFLYLRLHGQKDARGRLNYKYRYTDEELLKLKEMLFEARAGEIVVLFNNVYMKEDALRFKELISK